MSNNCNTCGGYVSAGGECRKCATPTNPPAKHPPRGTIWLCAVHVDCEDEQIHVAYTHEQFDVGTDYYPYVPAALLQEERKRGRAEGQIDAYNAVAAYFGENENDDLKDYFRGFADRIQATRSPGDAEKEKKNDTTQVL